MNTMKLNQAAALTLDKAPQHPKAQLPLGGRLVVEHLRDGQVIGEYDFPNDIVTEGKTFLLDVMFHGTSAASTWYIGLVDNASFGAYVTTVDEYDWIGQYTTIDNPNNWMEFTSYTDGNNSDNTTTRPEWPEDAASAASITNSSVAIFNITGSGTVKGIFVVGLGAAAMTKDDHGADGILWATANFGSGDVAVQSGDQLKVTYTVSA